jgi:hypothetical protein
MKQLFFLLLLTSLFSCKKENGIEPTDDNELITTVELVFTDPGNISRTFRFRDLDGDVRTPPEAFDTLRLVRNTEYKIAVLVSDESKGTKQDITASIKEEGDVHLFVYKAKPVSLLAIQLVDLDKYALPVGLNATAKTQYFPGNGLLQVLLKHQPPLNGKLVKTGDEDAGSTDLDVSFPVLIR